MVSLSDRLTCEHDWLSHKRQIVMKYLVDFDFSVNPTQYPCVVETIISDTPSNIRVRVVSHMFHYE